MKKIKISLLGKVALAIVAGIVFGQFLPEAIARIFVTFNSLFGTFLTFSIPLIILGLIVPAIGELGKGAGKLLVITVLIAYASTLFSGFFTYFSCDAVFPSLLSANTELSTISNPEEFMLAPYFTIGIPPLMDIMTALLLSFVLGIGISVISGTTLRGFFIDFRNIIVKLIESAIIPLLPWHIFGLFLNMTVSGQIANIMSTFLKVIIVIFVLHILLMLIQFTIAGIVGRKNPLRLLRNMLPAYATALGTQSSAATIPVTLRQVLTNGVRENIAVFVVPLCGTIHLAGSTMKITACAMAILMMAGEPVSLGAFAGFILMLSIVMVAAPGVPGGAIMASLGILHSMLGFDDTLQAMMIALYIAMDSFGTACNVTGDGAIAIVVDTIAKKEKNGDEKKKSSRHSPLLSNLSSLALLLAVFFFSSCGKEKAPQVTFELLLEEMVSVKESARYPEVPYRSYLMSSYDRRSVSADLEGWFANEDDSGFIRTETNEGRTEMVLFDEKEPGVITRIWISAIDKRGTWRFYFDGSPSANWELPAYDLMRFNVKEVGLGLLQPHTSYLPEGKGGSTLYFPIPYARSCKITFENARGVEHTPKAYQINFRRYPAGTIIETLSARIARRAAKKIAATDELLLDPVPNPKLKKDSIVLRRSQRVEAGIPMNIRLPQGEFAIYKLDIQVNCNPDDYARVMRNIVIQGIFDGKQTVWVPLSDFSGGGLGAPSVDSWYLSADGNGHVVSRWLMPYQQIASIAFTNQGNIPADVEVGISLIPNAWDSRTLYFHASWKQEKGLLLSNEPDSSALCKEWNFAEINGRGVYKGDVLTLYNHTQEWYGEGDEKIWVDGDTFPSHFGTGIDAYYNCSWAPVVSFQTPFGGATRTGPDASEYNTFFRTRNLDGIPFNNSFRFNLELLGRQKGQVDYASTIFWYGDIKARAKHLSGAEEIN